MSTPREEDAKSYRGTALERARERINFGRNLADNNYLDRNRNVPQFGNKDTPSYKIPDNAEEGMFFPTAFEDKNKDGKEDRTFDKDKVYNTGIGKNIDPVRKAEMDRIMKQKEAEGKAKGQQPAKRWSWDQYYANNKGRPGDSSIKQDKSIRFGNNTEQSVRQDNLNQTDNSVRTDIGNNNEFIGSAVGNNYSVTFTNQNGNNNPFANMERATMYNSLNNNALERSKSNLNGTGRAEMAIRQSEKQTGSRKIVENIYNAVGEDQQYWLDSARVQRAKSFGDQTKMRTPVWKAPAAPSDFATGKSQDK